MALELLVMGQMHATFLQKVILCAIAGFFAACLIQWGKVFVTGADDALNAGYKHTAAPVHTSGK
jgi:hypothetical protein